MKKKSKTILILGNGFDIAHGLPTKYDQFLKFCARVEEIWIYHPSSDGNTEENFRKTWIETWETDAYIKESIFEEFCKRKTQFVEGDFEVTSDNPVLSEIHENLMDNIWYNYFIKICDSGGFRGENWIDFESEIRFVIQSVDEHSSMLAGSWNLAMENAINAIMAANISVDEQWRKLRELQKIVNNDMIPNKNNQKPTPKITVKEFAERTIKDLQRMIRGFELYLGAYVEKIQDEGLRLPEIVGINPDYVIDFNYTDTYERLYGKGDVFHIHGTAIATRSPEENDMVLGIDEYWSSGDRDERTNFFLFRKSMQRVMKNTGSDHLRIMEEMREIYGKGSIRSGNEVVSNVYIFGCSLGTIDKDILSDFIGDDSTSVVIYCKDKDAKKMLMENTVKLIGQEKLLQKTNSSPRKLEYRLVSHNTLNG